MKKLFTRQPISNEKATVRVGKKNKQVSIISFLNDSHEYAESFGFQWERYAKIQIDRFNGTTITQTHLRQLLGFPLTRLNGKTILELGSGAGRYTDILRQYAQTVITVDPSAITSNVALEFPNVTAVRADLFDIPVNPQAIDIVFCRGVLQHTKDPIQAIKKICSYVKVGGSIVFDIYPRNWQSFFYTKYYLRPFTKRLNKKKVALFLEKNIPWMLRAKVRFINPLFPDVRYIREIPTVLFPIADYTRYAPLSKLSLEEHIQWSILDTFDMYTPEYDAPLSFNEVLKVVPQNTKVTKADEDQYHFVLKRIR